MIANEPINAAEALLQDTGNVRWDTTGAAGLVEYCADGERRIYDLRPGAFLATGDVMGAPSEPSATSHTLTLDERWREALAFYIAARALQEDSGDQANMRRAKEYMARFERIVATR